MRRRYHETVGGGLMILGFGLYILMTLVSLGGFALLVYAAYHFITKYW